MATVTLVIRLRRTDGRYPVDVDDLADAVVEEVEASVLELEVTDSEGEPATYEVTAVRAARQDEPAVADPEPLNSCAVCGSPILSARLGRPRLTCSDTCRQAAHRARRPAH
jgi:hypothetical protein